MLTIMSVEATSTTSRCAGNRIKVFFEIHSASLGNNLIPTKLVGIKFLFFFR